MTNRNQNVDDILHQIRQNVGGHHIEIALIDLILFLHFLVWCYSASNSKDWVVTILILPVEYAKVVIGLEVWKIISNKSQYIKAQA